jgi:Domain of unknown function (DUF1330)
MADVILRGGPVEVLEGSHHGRRLVVFEFPSMEVIRSVWNSPEYADVKKLREGAGELDVWAVPGGPRQFNELKAKRLPVVVESEAHGNACHFGPSSKGLRAGVATFSGVAICEVAEEVGHLIVD